MRELLTDVRGDVHIMELNRSRRLNALSRDLVEAFHGALDDAQREGARALVITGRGRAFCAGFDLKQVLSTEEENLQMARMQDVTARLREIAVPSVCAVHGHVVGAGLELALACDIVVATPEANLSFPDVRAGFAAGGGATFLLPRLIGLARARKVLMTGGAVNGAQAEAIGMIAETVHADDLRARALDIGEQLAVLDPEALLRVRTAIDAGLDGSLPEALDRELDDMVFTKHASGGATAVRNFRDFGAYAAPEGARTDGHPEKSKTARSPVSSNVQRGI